MTKIISGKWKGYKIRIPKNSNIRPTLGRIKETLFNWLNLNIKYSNCLDCFSGSGSLGIEALSRKANFVTFLEKCNNHAKNIVNNLTKLNITNAKVINIDTIKFLKKRGTPYNIIFIDPPFKKKLVKKTIFFLEKNNWIEKNSYIYIESEKNANLENISTKLILCKKKN